jgi:hypothetical protein
MKFVTEPSALLHAQKNEVKKGFFGFEFAKT